MGQGNTITTYNGTTKVADVQDAWKTNPSSDTVFVITPFGGVPGASAPTAATVADAVWDEAMSDHTAEDSYGSQLQSFHDGTAQSGGASSIVLDATGSSTTDDFYNFAVIEIIAGTGASQSRQITNYVQSTKTCTVDPAWTTAPDVTSQYTIKGLGIDAATVTTIADAVWDETRASHVAAGTFGEYTLSDAIRVSGSAAAADGLEAATTGATPLPSNMTQISDDATAATNAESFFDGNGYAGTNNVIPSVTNVTGDVVGNVDGNVGGNVTGSVGSVLGGIDTTGGTLTTLDGLDTAQDSQHSTTQATAANIETDTQDIQSRLPASLIGGRMDVDVEAINNDTLAADNLGSSALGIITGQCEGTPTTTVIQTDLAEATDDHFIGRVIVLTSGAGAQQATDITDYVGATGTLTVTLLTTAPVATDTFVIV